MGEWDSLTGILGLAFGLGLVHALDADHVIAVTALAGQPDGKLQRPWRFCLNWALGHGGSLLLLGVLVLAVGMAIPERLSMLAEFLVGAVLILMGAAVLVQLRCKRLRLHFHRHPGLSRHAHWQQPASIHTAHTHRATLVGALHGTAGSAPLLALIPVAQSASLWWGLAYLLVFSAGVLVSMLLCGGVLGLVFEHLSNRGQRVFDYMHAGIGAGAIVAGAYLLQSGF
ncbi:hypothetical protein MNBD_GAMMA13-1916 [hydrothermal vent metagenome]|uniref:Urease accessory protein UreH-like transmembrane domain-containing protein n=1 Tax=hydrothermal vent metagenome TaxID=652676 RepID=A0A3B0ZDZ8_9ZZZZ